MNEVSRCCRVLGVGHGATFEEVKAAYRDLVQVWHPDRFAGNERLQASAQDKLKEINVAWEYLSTHAFVNGILVDPGGNPPNGSAESTSSPEFSTASGSPSKRGIIPWIWGAAFLVVAGALVFALSRTHQTQVIATNETSTNVEDIAPPSSTVEPASSVTPPESPTNRIYPFAIEVLAGHARTNLNGWLEFPPLLEPPFAVRLEASVDDLSDFRLHYAIGQVIFNWSDHPKDLLIESPQNAVFTSVPGAGILFPGSTREIIWIVQTNQMSVQVDGKTRFQTNDQFAGLKGCVSVGPFEGPVKLTTFEIQTPEDPSKSNTLPSDRKGSADNLLPTMVPEKNLTEHFTSDGVTIHSGIDSQYGLMCPQSFSPPFTIRTRAKIDAHDLRIFCENGMIIFNWELNNRELRVHDPLNGACTPVANLGFILPNEWHTITWSVQLTGMTVSVDGRTLFQNHRNYRAVTGKIGIGVYKSELTVDYFEVEKK